MNPADARAGLESRVRAHIRRQRDATVRMLRELVRRDSPSHHEGRAHDGGSAVGCLAAAIAGNGTEVHQQVHSSASESLVEVLRGPGDGGLALAFVAHTDVVSAGDPAAWMGSGPFGAEIGTAELLGGVRVAIEVAGERCEADIRERTAALWQARGEPRREIVYGRGSFDDKGAVVSAAAAMTALAAACHEAGLSLGGDLISAYTTDEELDASGIRRFGVDADSWLATHGYLAGRRDAQGMTRDLQAIVLEGSYGWAPVVGHRGGMHVLVRVRGRSAHASTPGHGVNAVAAMARIIGRLADDDTRLRARFDALTDASLLGPMTMAPGTTIVGGGIRSVRRDEAGLVVERVDLNVVPEWCEATIDVRFPPLTSTAVGSDPASAIIEVLRAWIEEEFRGAGWEASLSLVPGTYMPAVSLGRTTDEASRMPLLRSARNAATRVLGRDPGLAIAPGGSDATYLINEGRVSALVELGPSGGLSHDTHEFVDVADVIDGAEILALLAIDHLGVVARQDAGRHEPT